MQISNVPILLSLRFRPIQMLSLVLVTFLFSACSISLESGVSQAPDPYAFLPVDIEPYTDLKLIQSSVIYPAEARRLGIQGKVNIRVLVTKIGKPMRPFIESSDSKLLEPEAIRVVMLAKFTPARQRNGQPLDCWVSIPIIFRL